MDSPTPGDILWINCAYLDTGRPAPLTLAVALRNARGPVEIIPIEHDLAVHASRAPELRRDHRKDVASLDAIADMAHSASRPRCGRIEIRATLID